jgi:ribosomal protein S18 acetylase RimI-like enzyme
MEQEILFRTEPRVEDAGRVFKLAEATGFFNQEETQIARELVEERLGRGEASGYFFVFAEIEGCLAGYSCYGPIPATRSSFDLYWIVVHPDFQRRGLGRKILLQTEKLISSAGGRRIYVDTSTRPQYAPTRAFYQGCGYRLEAELEDFYAPGDGKAIYCKVIC